MLRMVFTMRLAVGEREDVLVGSGPPVRAVATTALNTAMLSCHNTPSPPTAAGPGVKAA